jgi:hypothetical protein
MIDVVRARSGAEVLIANGRYLASPYDPVREGDAWAARAARGLASGAGAIALGFGSGYGPLALQRLIGSERLAILEASQDAVARGQGMAALGDFDFTRVAAAQTPDGALACLAAQAVATRRFSIVAFGPSMDACPSWYRRARALLTAREPEAFLRALELRPGLRDALELEKLNEALDRPCGLVSVQSIARLLRKDACGREAAVWRALGELAS